MEEGGESLRRDLTLQMDVSPRAMHWPDLFCKVNNCDFKGKQNKKVLLYIALFIKKLPFRDIGP